jgi:tRNA 2-selenouridine synthase
MELPERVCPPLSLADFPDIIDVRSPLEFAEDHLPGAMNLPVLDDQERHRVGLLHASNPYEARRLGATLITRNIHRHLATTLAGHPSSFAPLLYCWRGNLRSNSMALVFRSIGWRARVLDGGYKAWRRSLIHDLEPSLSRLNGGLVILAGLTGCGKTRLLQELAKQGAQILDLEGLANHRGSILGRSPVSPQPSQKRFESLLWEKLQSFDPTQPIFTEAESNRIGDIQCPSALWKQMARGKVVLVETPLAQRARLLAEDYHHFIENPERLKETLNGLRRLRGNQQVDRWFQQIDQEDWPSFLESILNDHYDQCYRRPGSPDSVYKDASRTVAIPEATKEGFEEAASLLLAKSD